MVGRGDGDREGETLSILSLSLSLSSIFRDVEVFRGLKEGGDSFVGRLLLPVAEDLERLRCEPFADFWPPFMQFTSFGKYIIIKFKDLTANIWSTTLDHQKVKQPKVKKSISYRGFLVSEATESFQP